MIIIDTHAHLDHLKDLKDALIVSDQQGVESIITVSEDYASSKKNLDISQPLIPTMSPKLWNK